MLCQLNVTQAVLCSKERVDLDSNFSTCTEVAVPAHPFLRPACMGTFCAKIYFVHAHAAQAPPAVD